ncbi:RNA polymerase II transcription factor B subunit 4 [Exophiala xenobiotica]|uniref:General transcription and DNA repair factor IIH subunit TFB4 n=1 Tax=Lithohypha guttulata TaxID=1690604 RepID=A0ABR0KP16_9EURO|nr:RNA polymerase II transcription factor B subunit 4 [Lithohypha guttulata]KAK5328881.1 RNA polymerase II transcription factor B subunit 4 [Exophiala xenobiotica]
MDGADGSQHFSDELPSREQSPSLLTIILDTNPAAWALIDSVLPISNAVANLLVFINAHLACNYTNQVAVIASHCDKAHWLYPTASVQKPRQERQHSSRDLSQDDDDDEVPTNRNKRVKLNVNGTSATQDGPTMSETESNKYRPYRLIEEELVRNLRSLTSSTSPATIQETSSTKVAGALTLALSYINRRSQEYQESSTGISASLADQAVATATDSSNSSSNVLQSRILIITLSPSTDLAHQYIPIMNSIFACQRLNIPIDVLQLPLLPSDPKQKHPEPVTTTTDISNTPTQTSTVFLQQASDATHGIFILAHLTPPPPQSSASTPDPPPTTRIATNSMLTYLLTSFLSAPSTRHHLITPTRIDVDFRAACFCHRNIIPTGYVCSICLSIFCDQSLEALDREGCLTCGTELSVRGQGVGSMGRTPVVVAAKKKKRKKGGVSGVGTPRAETPV